MTRPTNARLMVMLWLAAIALGAAVLGRMCLRGPVVMPCTRIFHPKNRE